MGWGTIGTGRLDTIGHGAGTGPGYAIGAGRGPGTGRTAKAPPPTIGYPQGAGELDGAIIRRYVRRKLRRITTCYERELVVHNNLSGTIVSQFTINPKGKVLSSKASGMGNKNVERCVAQAISSIEFPVPKGGGFVRVTRYPFTFRSGGR